MLTNFLLYFAFFILTPLLPLYLNEQFGATKDVIGIVLSGYVVASVVVRPFSGYVVDSFSRKKVLMFCLTAFFICLAETCLRVSDFQRLSYQFSLSLALEQQDFGFSCCSRLF